MKKLSTLLSTIIIFSFSNFITSDKDKNRFVEENNITRTVEYDEVNKNDNEKFYNITSFLDKNNRYITTCKRDFSYDMLSNVDNVSLPKIDKYIGETINYEIIFDVSNMKYYQNISLDSYEDEKYTLEGTIIRDEQNINIVFEDDKGNKFYLSNLTNKNSINSVSLFSFFT